MRIVPPINIGLFDIFREKSQRNGGGGGEGGVTGKELDSLENGNKVCQHPNKTFCICESLASMLSGAVTCSNRMQMAKKKNNDNTVAF